MLFNSLRYLIYFPVVVIFFFIFPFKYRWVWLLVSSYYFYMCWNPKYAVLMLISTSITYYSGILMDKADNITEPAKRKRRKKLYVILSLTINLAILFFFKYFNFFNFNLKRLLLNVGLIWPIPNFNILLPVGISFYTFQALSYTIDVYRGDIRAEKHFGRYALFVSFFPQLVAGPIEKSVNLLPQFKEKHIFNYNTAKEGLILILWGFFKKIVIADRVAILVNTVYNNPSHYKGIELMIATVFFAAQIYCDFSSYSDIAIGSAQVMGYKLMKNFDAPYYSKTIQEFWKRWHISLGDWFKSYLFIPLGGSRVSRILRYRNILIVFVTSGLWHGASWNFVIWGMLHGLYQVLGIILKPLRDKMVIIFKVDRTTLSHKLYKVVATFLLVDFAWIFFRANSLRDALYIVKNLFLIDINIFAADNIYKLGLNKNEFLIAIYGLVILAAIDLIKNKVHLLFALGKQGIIFRYTVYLFLLASIVIFGQYSISGESQFIYFQF